jgi:methionyl-tRNA synthetase
MEYFAHTFKDTTGFRLVDVPNETLEREVPQMQVRVANDKGKVRLVKFDLYDPDTGEYLFDRLLEGMMQPFLLEHGKRCEMCEMLYLQTSPSQKLCPDCREKS